MIARGLSNFIFSISQLTFFLSFIPFLIDIQLAGLAFAIPYYIYNIASIWMFHSNGLYARILGLIIFIQMCIVTMVIINYIIGGGLWEIM